MVGFGSVAGVVPKPIVRVVRVARIGQVVRIERIERIEHIDPESEAIGGVGLLVAKWDRPASIRRALKQQRPIFRIFS